MKNKDETQDQKIKKQANTESSNDNRPGFIELVTKNIPLADLTMAFVIPKVIFNLMASRDMVVPGLLIGVSWAVGYGIYRRLRVRKTDWFAVLAVFMLIGKALSHFRSLAGIDEVLALALDSFIFGAVFLISVFTSRSLVEFFVESSNASGIPDIVKETPYYSNTWIICSIVWGSVNLILGGLIIYLGHRDMELARTVDSLSGLPATIVLISFCVGFPRWYWPRNWEKIEKAAAEKKALSLS